MATARENKLKIAFRQCQISLWVCGGVRKWCLRIEQVFRGLEKAFTDKTFKFVDLFDTRPVASHKHLCRSQVFCLRRVSGPADQATFSFFCVLSVRQQAVIPKFDLSTRNSFRNETESGLKGLATADRDRNAFNDSRRAYFPANCWCANKDLHNNEDCKQFERLRADKRAQRGGRLISATNVD